jgi:hypothetical protein
MKEGTNAEETRENKKKQGKTRENKREGMQKNLASAMLVSVAADGAVKVPAAGAMSSVRCSVTAFVQ